MRRRVGLGLLLGVLGCRDASAPPPPPPPPPPAPVPVPVPVPAPAPAPPPSPDGLAGPVIAPGSGGTGEGSVAIGRIGTGSGWSGRPTALTLGQVTVTGGDLPPEVVTRYLRRFALRLAYCYEAELAARPTLAGKATLSFALGLDGKAVGARVATFDPTVDACVAAVVGAIPFPPPPAIVQVRVPLTFKPVPAPKGP